MAVIQRQWRAWLAVVAILAGVFLLWDRKTFGHTPADETISVATTFASLDNGVHDADPAAGVVEIDGNLTIAAGGSITCNDPASPNSASACPINLVVTGDLLIEAGGAIYAENRVNGGAGGDITITVGGDFTMEGPSGGNAGAIVSSRKLGNGTANGGDIEIVVGGVTLNESVYPHVGVCNSPDGDILVEAGATITSDANGHAGDIALYAGRDITIDGTVRSEGFLGAGHGGAITIDACCDLFVQNDGLVRSAGRDPGPDRVHLEACVIEIFGVVESTGPAHQSPSALCTPPTRPGKAANSTACVEIWSGTSVLIDSTGTNHGQVNADTGMSGGVEGHSWIDIFANGDITIIDGTGNDHVQPIGGSPSVPVLYAVHANQYLGNGNGGDIDIESKAGAVSTSGNAIQANDLANGGDGGRITVEAGGAGSPAGDVALDAASIEARGANHPNSFGGLIAVQSFNGDITGAPPGLLNASAHATHPGSISLTSCLGPSYTGGSNPAAVPLGGVCGGMPAFPALTPPEAYPTAACVQFCTPPTATPTDTPTNTPTDTPTNTPTDTPTNTPTDTPTNTPTDTPTNTPTDTPTNTPTDTPTNTPTPTKTPTFTPTPGRFCPEDPSAILTKSVGPLAQGHPYQTVQAAYDAAVNGDVIGLFSETLENVVLGGAKTLEITQCTTAKITAANNALPVWTVSSTGKLTIIGVDSVGGTIGFNITTSNHELKSIRAYGASQYGVLILGNNVSVSLNEVGSDEASKGGPNGVGIRVTGSGADLGSSGDVHFNTGDGIQLAGTGAQLDGVEITDNGGNGVLVSGSNNTVENNSRINDNALNGILVTGDGNTISGNRSESGKGNTLNGIRVDAGADNNAINENDMFSNGAAGFSIFGTGNSLEKNTATNNTGNEFEIGAGNVDGGDNEANGVDCTFNAAGGTCN
ncbi:MAG TPA: right-handed parallel beta-helix repeat-containing protein [Thermoanaerobaculia bacterium]|nr:right-handed parallel beta-helix repeat-containing protein [Thermoanaerobaculia bacterium]